MKRNRIISILSLVLCFIIGVSSFLSYDILHAAESLPLNTWDTVAKKITKTVTENGMYGTSGSFVSKITMGDRGYYDPANVAFILDVSASIDPDELKGLQDLAWSAVQALAQVDATINICILQTPNAVSGKSSAAVLSSTNVKNNAKKNGTIYNAIYGVKKINELVAGTMFSQALQYARENTTYMKNRVNQYYFIFGDGEECSTTPAALKLDDDAITFYNEAKKVKRDDNAKIYCFTIPAGVLNSNNAKKNERAQRTAYQVSSAYTNYNAEYSTTLTPNNNSEYYKFYQEDWVDIFNNNAYKTQILNTITGALRQTKTTTTDKSIPDNTALTENINSTYFENVTGKASFIVHDYGDNSETKQTLTTDSATVIKTPAFNYLSNIIIIDKDTNKDTNKGQETITEYIARAKPALHTFSDSQTPIANSQPITKATYQTIAGQTIAPAYVPFINYVMNDGSNKVAIYEYNNTSVVTPTRTGYKFIGWNTKADGSGTSVSGALKVSEIASSNGKTLSKSASPNITLYAQWEDVTYHFYYTGCSELAEEKIDPNANNNNGRYTFETIDNIKYVMDSNLTTADKRRYTDIRPTFGIASSNLNKDAFTNYSTFGIYFSGEIQDHAATNDIQRNNPDNADRLDNPRKIGKRWYIYNSNNEPVIAQKQIVINSSPTLTINKGEHIFINEDDVSWNYNDLSSKYGLVPGETYYLRTAWDAEINLYGNSAHVSPETKVQDVRKNEDTALIENPFTNYFILSYHLNDSEGPKAQLNGYGSSTTVNGNTVYKENVDATFQGWSTTKGQSQPIIYEYKQTINTASDMNLYAQWLAPSTTPTPTREGYTFMGWSYIADEADVDLPAGSSHNLRTDTNLFAVWEPNFTFKFASSTDDEYSYIPENNTTILNSLPSPGAGTYVTNISTGNIFTQEITPNTDLSTNGIWNYTSFGIQKDGYVPMSDAGLGARWNVYNEDGTPVMKDGKQVYINEDDTSLTYESLLDLLGTAKTYILKTAWNADKYMLKFNTTANGGLASNLTQSVSYGDSISNLPDAQSYAKDGWKFEYWSTSPNSTIKFDANTFTMPAEDVTLYAVYSKELTATFISLDNDGNKHTETETVKIYNNNTNGSIAVPTFSDANDVAYSYGLKATGKYLPIDVKFSEDALLTDGVTAASTISIDKDSTFYAIYKTRATIKYDANGGSTTPEDTLSEELYVYRDNRNILTTTGYGKAILADTINKEGYVFDGWKVWNSYIIEANGEYWGDEGDVKAVAVWTPITYTIEYKPNGATEGSVSSTTATYDKNITISENKFSYAEEGYTFYGWNTKADGSGDVYAENETVKNLTSTNNDVITLYAQWATYAINSDIKSSECLPGSVIEYTLTLFVPDSANNVSMYGYVPDGTKLIPSSLDGKNATTNSDNTVITFTEENVEPGTTITKTYQVEIQPTYNNGNNVQNNDKIINNSTAAITVDASNTKYINSNDVEDIINFDYSINYIKKDGETGEAPIDDNKYEGGKDEPATIKENTLEKEGYTFIGWKDPDTNDIYNENEEITVTKTVTLEAVWAKVVKTAECEKPIPGEEIIYTIAVELPDDIASAALTDTITGSCEIIDVAFAPDTIVPVVNGNTIKTTINTIEGTSSYTLTIKVKIDENVNPGTHFENEATLVTSNNYTLTSNTTDVQVGYKITYIDGSNYNEVNYVNGEVNYTGEDVFYNTDEDGNIIYYQNGNSATILGPKKDNNNKTHFISWNTQKDGCGDTYKADDEINVNKNLVLYAMRIDTDKVITAETINTEFRNYVPSENLSYNISFTIPTDNSVTITDNISEALTVKNIIYNYYKVYISSNDSNYDPFTIIYPAGCNLTEQDIINAAEIKWNASLNNVNVLSNEDINAEKESGMMYYYVIADNTDEKYNIKEAENFIDAVITDDNAVICTIDRAAANKNYSITIETIINDKATPSSTITNTANITYDNEDYSTDTAEASIADYYRVFYQTVEHVGSLPKGEIPIDTHYYRPDEIAEVMSADTLSQKGCIFSEWNTAEDGTGTVYQTGDKEAFNKDITLYAIFVTEMELPHTGSNTIIILGMISAICACAYIYLNKKEKIILN